jgi:hypothetical protein
LTRQHIVAVKPSSGWPATVFTVSFRAPDRTGRYGGEYRYYAVSATGPSGSGGCVGRVTRYVGATAAPARVRVKLRPGAEGWCLGTFRGSVTEEERPVCPNHEACPLYIVRLKTIGQFTFHVQKSPPGTDTTPPVFAGLKSAFQCFPGPMRPDGQRPVGLSWRAASDDVTPSSEIRYDIYMASTPGGEDFSRPNWTTRGNTSFTTPSLPPGRYFVVRARDQAGNEDHNTVERRAENPCV